MWARRLAAGNHVGTRTGSTKPDLPAQVGEEIAGYELRGILGQGGMGCVFDAIHTKLGRRSALKFLASELVNSDEYVKRFLSEARIVNSVRHPNIVDIYDFIELERPKRVAYVMELVSGQSLGTILKARRLTVKQAVNVTLQLADALRAVHQRGVVHRDLKPDNVLVNGDLDGDLAEVPSIKVLDFGIAKSSAASVDHRTVTGAILGTPSYMAPEQVAGHDVSAATDIYAIGEIFYEMVSGRRLFQGDRIQMMTQKLGGTAPSIDLPDDLEGQEVVRALIDQCLKVQPDERPTIVDVTGYMNEILAHQSEDISSTLLTPLPAPTADPSPTPMAMASVAELTPAPAGPNTLHYAVVAVAALALGVGASVLVLKAPSFGSRPAAAPTSSGPTGPSAAPVRTRAEVTSSKAHQTAEAVSDGHRASGGAGRGRPRPPTRCETAVRRPTKPNGAAQQPSGQGGARPPAPGPSKAAKAAANQGRGGLDHQERNDSDMVKVILQAVLLAAFTVASTGVFAANGREEFEKGSRYFKAEEYEAALPYFRKAYEMSGHRPAAVFALAQCERSLKMYGPAIQHFREYLESKPANAADVEETIALLQELLVQQRAKNQSAREKARKAEAQRRAEAKRRAQADAEAKRRAHARAQEEADAREKAEAEVRRLKLEARAAPAPAPRPSLAAETPLAAASEDHTIFESSWFWVITGAIAVGGAVTAGGPSRAVAVPARTVCGNDRRHPQPLGAIHA